MLVPGLTLDRARLEALAAYLEPYRCIRKVELLPFHKMADFKWKALGLENRLADHAEPEAAALPGGRIPVSRQKPGLPAAVSGGIPLLFRQPPVDRS